MSRQSWRHFGLFFVGFVLLVSSLAVGLSAVNYEFYHLPSAEEPPVHAPVSDYENLSANDRQVVRGALDGKRYVFPTKPAAPGLGGGGLRGRTLITYQGQTHVFARQVAFDASSPNGLATIALALGGFTLVVEAIRRRHFPHYRPFPSHR